MTEKICGTCKFWEQHFDDDQGSCRRYPPVLDVLAIKRIAKSERGEYASESMIWWSQPVTAVDSECGEHLELVK